MQKVNTESTPILDTYFRSEPTKFKKFTFFIVLDKDGYILEYTEKAKKKFGIAIEKGSHINEIDLSVTEEIWENEPKDVEMFWNREDDPNHSIFQSIPFDWGCILCFREVEKPKKLKTGTLFDHSFSCFPGISEEIKRKVEQAAKNNIPILITGESGVGKEVLARLTHLYSNVKGPFIPINCTSIPRDLVESELFGYECGAFTGAKKEGKPGKFELADGGTLFLDEIADMPYEHQCKLLRIIEEKKVWRIGAKKQMKLNFTLICATNQPIERLVEKNAFRADLYYRIAAVRIHLSPLKERMEYFNDFISYFLEKHVGKDITFSLKSMKLLKSYPWPGNIRELEQVIKLMIIKKEGSRNKIVRTKDLPEKVIESEEKIPRTLHEKIEELKSKEIKKTLEKHNGNRTRAAKELGISRVCLIKWIKKLEL